MKRVILSLSALVMVAMFSGCEKPTVVESEQVVDQTVTEPLDLTKDVTPVEGEAQPQEPGEVATSSEAPAETIAPEAVKE